MSGHSKWSSIKHKKGAADAKRGKLFTKLARAITVAARDGGGDPEANFDPGDRRAKGPRRLDAQGKHPAGDRPRHGGRRRRGRDRAVLFEGYGPGGAAILVEALTDNRNRTSADVRHAFTKHDGNLGEPGSVAWIFEKRGVDLVDAKRYGEDDLIVGDRRRRRRRARDGDSCEVISAARRPGAVRERARGRGVEVGVEPTSRWSRRPPSRSASRTPAA